MPNSLAGIEVILSHYLTETYEVAVPLTWRERLMPVVVSDFPRLLVRWCPWVFTRMEQRERPRRAGFMIGGKLMMHPETFRALKEVYRG